MFISVQSLWRWIDLFWLELVDQGAEMVTAASRKLWLPSYM